MSRANMGAKLLEAEQLHKKASKVCVCCVCSQRAAPRAQRNCGSPNGKLLLLWLLLLRLWKPS